MLPLLAGLFLAQSPSGQTPPLPPPPPLVSGTQAERAAKTVRELVALGPRMGGTPSGDLAVKYLTRAFTSMGLENRTIEEEERLVHWENSWSLEAIIQPPAGSQVESIPLVRTWPYGFSPAAAGEAPVRLQAEDGEVGLFSKFHRPSRNGPALALALVDGFNTPIGDWPKLRPLRATARNRYPVFGISAEDGQRLRAAIEDKREVLLKYELDAHIEKRPSRSVEAILPARKAAPPGYFLVCAHGDSDAGGPGANDNGSGVAIVLEMARSWKSAIDSGSCKAPARQVRFVIWGSEIKSTREYLNEHLRRKGEGEAAPLLGVLNFDQAGFGAGAEQLNVEPDDLASNRAFVELACQQLAHHKPTQGFPKRWATNRSLGGTDSYVFSGSKLFREQGLPSVTFFTSAWDKPEEHRRTPDMPGESWKDREKVGVDYDPYYPSAGDLPQMTTSVEAHNMLWCARTGLVCVNAYLESL